MTEQETVSPPAPATERSRLPWRAIAVVVAVVVVAAAGLGALGGWLWYQWWGPPNTGAIYDTATWGPRWIDLTDQGLGQQFDGPAQYAVIGLGFGTLLGILGAVLGRRQAIAALVGLVVGSALAAYLAFVVGTALSPPDPERYATEANVCREEPCKDYPAAIEVSGWTPFLCWPIGALGGFSLTIAVMTWIGSTRTKLDDLEPLTPHPARVREPDGRRVP
ncbi:hypothetical protein SFC88_07330 [Nocardioides sp. HM23]|uniref:hypothetical protein n=1 Tax=Nocardioides bizhenqiangii TaxID=3095076 RepID=UPI002ACA3E35|nr:hypothetical protein [Nocardioides sp. HM23]MDZ5620629.1 hypothetical protein [Nocardioides sp. HM23]